MNEVIFAGYYGMSNFGDDLFGVIASYGQREYWPEARSQVLAPGSGNRDADYYVRSRFLGKLYSEHIKLGAAVRLGYSISAVIKSDQFIYCGGSLFTGGSFGGRRVSDALAKSKLSAIGVSIGPFLNGDAERRTIERLKRFNYIAVRDRSSSEICTSNGLEGRVVLAADLAGAIPRYLAGDVAAKDKNDRSSLVLGFIPCAWSDRDAAEMWCRDFVRAAILLSNQRQLFVEVLILNEHSKVGDWGLGRLVCSELEKNDIAYRISGYQSIGISGTIKLISSMDLLITARLHGGVVASVVDTPFVLCEYHKKCTDFLNDIDYRESYRVGLGEGVYDAARMILECDKGGEVYSASELVSRSLLNFAMAPWA